MDATYSDTTAEGQCEGEKVITRTWSLVDNCGNTLEQVQTITVKDNIVPTIDVDAMDETVECDGNGNDDELKAWLDANGGASASDTCSGVVWSNDFTALSDECGATGSVTVDFTATDDCGNSTTTTATFTVEDTTDPTIDEEAKDEIVECDGEGNQAQLQAWLDANGGAAASDLCGDVVWSNDFTALSDDCGATMGYRICISTFRATDDCGNYSETQATFTIVDTTNPTIDFEAIGETVECDGLGNDDALKAWLDANGGASASDLCSGVVWSNDFTALSDDCGATGSALVTFRATDDCGNYSETQATFTIVDTTNPTIDFEAIGETVECDGLGNDDALKAWLDANGGASASDLCSGVVWSNDFTALSDDCGATGSALVTFRATDDCGNYSETQATFTIVDTTNPTIDVEAIDETVECDGLGNGDALNAWLDANGGASASDLCSGVVWSNDFTALSDDCGATGSALVTFKATDDCGNYSETQATFTIEDTTAPTIDVDAMDETVECDGLGNDDALKAWLDANGGASASDLCSGVVWSNDFTALSDDCGETGSALVTFKATDDCGNYSETQATFTIVDTTNPTIDVEARGETVECDGLGNDDALKAWLDANGGASASDLCSGVVWSNDFTALSDDCGATGSALVTFKATDDCGNYSETQATFTIEDTTAPTFTAPADTDLDCADDTSIANTGDVIDEADNCSTELDAQYTDETIAGNCDGNYVILRTWSLVDNCGNEADDQVQTITVTDTTAPVLTGVIPASINEINGCASEAPTPLTEEEFALLFEDNCSNVVVSLFSSPVGNDCGWSIIHIYTVSDECDNLLGDFKVYYSGEDLTAPVLNNVPGDLNLECGVDPIPDPANVTATDYCDPAVEVDFSERRVNGDCEGNYDIIRTWSATDACGNPVTATQTIRVRDNEAPVLITGVLPEGSNENDLCAPNTDEELAALGVLTAGEFALLYTDNCSSGVNVNRVINLDGDDCKWIMWVRYDITDYCGNDAQSVKLWYHGADMTAPTFTAPVDTMIYADANCTYDADPSITGDVDDEADNCSTGLQATYDDVVADGSCIGEKIITRTWSLMDDCNNEAVNQVQVITVTDNTPPTFDSDPAGLSDIACNGKFPVQEVLTASDTCGSATVVPSVDAYTVDICSGYDVTYRWTATDACGNSSETTATFSVLPDTTDPTFDSDPAGLSDIACNGTFPDQETLTASDDCSTVSVVPSVDAYTVDICAGYAVTYRWTATDACGNDTETTATFNVLPDTTDPTFDSQPAGLNDIACNGTFPDQETLTASDDCSTVSVVPSVDAYTVDICSGYDVTYRWTATDACGNSSETTATFSVLPDTTDPTLIVSQQD